MEPPERLALLQKHKIKVKAAGSVLTNPKEGDFWQADHIVPVSEGGGECDLDNFRTLCTRCHAQETARLKHRLKLRPKNSLAKVGAGMKSIQSFFFVANKSRPKKKKKTRTTTKKKNNNKDRTE